MQHWGALLQADISGFTRLSETLSSQGPQGVEQLSRLLNAYFGQIIDIAHEHGGEVVKFAGDALLIRWHGNGESDLAVERAEACGLALSRLNDQELERGIRLSLRMAIGGGELIAALLGGVRGRWEVFLTGAAFEQVRAGLALVPPKGVLVSREAWELSRRWGRGSWLDGGLLLENQAEQPVLERWTPPRFEPEDLELVKACVPLAARTRLTDAEGFWLAERLVVTALFVNIPALGSIRLDTVGRAHQVVRLIQESLYRYWGSLDKVMADDKGTSVVAAFGLPPVGLEERALRAVRAARDIQEALWGLGLDSAIGISTGKVVCGPVGNDQRREYTLISPVMNLAARLMQESLREGGAILCDSATYRAARMGAVFEDAGPRRLKGFEGPVPTYRVLGLRRREQLRAVESPSDPIVGRREELQIVEEALEGLLVGTGGLLLIRGEAGVGKTRLAEELRARAARLGVTAYTGHADMLAGGAPYQPWRRVFARIFGVEGIEDETLVRRRVQELLQEIPGALEYGALLDAVLPGLDWDAGASTSLAGSVRASRTQELLLSVLRHRAQRGHLLLVLENFQWADSSSWALLRRVRRELPSALVALCMRPVEGEPPPELVELLSDPELVRIELDALEPDAVAELAARRLGVDSVPAELASFLHEKSQGNPFFLEELVYALRERGLLKVEAGRLVDAPSTEELAENPVPARVEEIVSSRITRLPQEAQLTLKAAAVVGQVFTQDVLDALLEMPREEIRRQVDRLREAGLVGHVRAAARPTYIFRQRVTLEVAYDRLLQEQRVYFHRRVAEWMEREDSDSLDSQYPVLAYHWERAQDYGRAVDAWERAGELALRSGAHREARRFFQRALELAETRLAPQERRPSRLARWQRGLGDAAYGLGDFEASDRHFLQALETAGYPFRPSLWSMALALLARGVLSFVKGLAPSWVEVAGERALLMKEAARAAERLAERYYFKSDLLQMLLSTLRAVNLVDRAGPTPDVSRAYSFLAVAVGMLRLNGLARRYFDRALRLARRAEDPPGEGFQAQARGILALGYGWWEQAREAFSEALELHRSLGEMYEVEIDLTGLGSVALFTGDYQRCLEYFKEVGELARRSGSAQHEAWSTFVEGEVLLIRGCPEEALGHLQRARELLQGSDDIASEIKCLGLLALALAESGRLDEAWKVVQEANALVRRERFPAMFAEIAGYAGIYQALLLLERAGWPRKRLDPLRRRMLRAATLHSLFFPVSRARVALLRGMEFELRGRRRQALRRFRLAERLGASRELPLEATLARLYRARLEGDEEAEVGALDALHQLGARETPLLRPGGREG